MPKQWLSPAPVDCQICRKEVVDDFVDGKTVMGPWAIMCWACSKLKGVGLGLGKGQRYHKNAEGKWIQVAGRIRPFRTGI